MGGGGCTQSALDAGGPLHPGKLNTSGCNRGPEWATVVVVGVCAPTVCLDQWTARNKPPKPISLRTDKIITSNHR